MIFEFFFHGCIIFEKGSIEDTPEHEELQNEKTKTKKLDAEGEGHKFCSRPGTGCFYVR